MTRLEADTSLDHWVRSLLAFPGMSLMGHGQQVEGDCLGLGWVYYGLARLQRPHTVIVIGSWRGFVPLVLGRALADNGDGGHVVFIDPSLVDDFWKDPEVVRTHFARFGVGNIRHHCLDTAAFARTDAFRAINGAGILFVDGMHTYEQAKLDFETFRDRLADDAIVLFHDSIRVRVSHIYGEDRPYEHRVRDYMEELRGDPELELFDLPFADGVTLLRRRGGT